MAFSNFSSRLFGKVAKCNFPSFLQKLINKAYVKYFDIDMSEFKQPDEYLSLNELFTRTLQIQRKIEDEFISPSDGKILELGQSFDAKDEKFAFSIKGFTYSLNELLKNSYEDSEFKNGLDYVNIYLSPKDYHRFHSPFDMQILSATYVSGELFSVSEKKLSKVANLYTKNERFILKCLVKNFYIWLVFVGAQNVGSIRLSFDESIQTNANKGNFTKTYDSLFLNKADELGHFEMGSTIVLIAQSKNLSFKPLANSTVKFGEKIATFL
ncbi:MAG TPA: phosphatidylserine decarboxylase [Campylobacter avium]|uniref:phosphatidylserine decarboxylase n=1 Tax=Campylobacter avium TaxID=522485 RepID=UPI001D298C64|nr:phosphatidylserine decarboxylase [Campylobacter avium]HJE66294.1 phosphatidylserine decarboxylase [Campylobacter avium]